MYKVNLLFSVCILFDLRDDKLHRSLNSKFKIQNSKLFREFKEFREWPISPISPISHITLGAQKNLETPKNPQCPQ